MLCPAETLHAVVDLHTRGLTYQAIADLLNTSGLPTPAGRPNWTRAHVFRLVRTAAARDLSRDPPRPLGRSAAGLTQQMCFGLVRDSCSLDRNSKSPASHSAGPLLAAASR